MKRAGKWLLAVIAAAVLAMTFALTGCGGRGSVVSIEKTGDRGSDIVYTVTYEDGSTSELVIEGGKDGQDVTAYDLWQTYIQQTGDEIKYEDFLEKYLTFDSDDNSAVIGETLLSGVKVYSEFIEWGGTMLNPREVASVYTGGGVIYSMDGEDTYILTNYHVTYNKKASPSNAKGNTNGANVARKVVCYLYGSEGTPDFLENRYDEYGFTAVDYGNYAIECEYVGGSVVSDIAVLRADTDAVLAINEQAQAVTVADGYCVGDTAYTIGNPEDEGISVTEGIVSVADEYILLNVDGTARQYRSIRIDTPLYGGNSGGGLFNTDGELIGIANAGNEADQNINFAIPLEIVAGTADNIIYYYEDGDDSTNGVYKIDFTETNALYSQNSRYVYDKDTGKGEIVEDVVLGLPSGMADELGLKSGDIMRSFIIGRNGESIGYEVKRTFDISDILFHLRPGDTLSVKYERENNTGNVTKAVTISSEDLLPVA